MNSFFALGTSFFVRDKKAVKTNALFIPHVILTSDDATVVHHDYNFVKPGFCLQSLCDRFEIFHTRGVVYSLPLRYSLLLREKIPSHLAVEKVYRHVVPPQSIVLDNLIHEL